MRLRAAMLFATVILLCVASVFFGVFGFWVSASRSGFLLRRRGLQVGESAEEDVCLRLAVEPNGALVVGVGLGSRHAHSRVALSPSSTDMWLWSTDGDDPLLTGSERYAASEEPSTTRATVTDYIFLGKHAVPVTQVRLSARASGSYDGLMGLSPASDLWRHYGCVDISESTACFRKKACAPQSGSAVLRLDGAVGAGSKLYCGDRVSQNITRVSPFPDSTVGASPVLQVPPAAAAACSSSGRLGDPLVLELAGVNLTIPNTVTGSVISSGEDGQLVLPVLALEGLTVSFDGLTGSVQVANCLQARDRQVVAVTLELVLILVLTVYYTSTTSRHASVNAQSVGSGAEQVYDHCMEAVAIGLRYAVTWVEDTREAAWFSRTCIGLHTLYAIFCYGGGSNTPHKSNAGIVLLQCLQIVVAAAPPNNLANMKNLLVAMITATGTVFTAVLFGMHTRRSGSVEVAVALIYWATQIVSAQYLANTGAFVWASVEWDPFFTTEIMTALNMICWWVVSNQLVDHSHE